MNEERSKKDSAAYAAGSGVRQGISGATAILAIYLALSPMEDVFRSEGGSLQRYLALTFLGVSMMEALWRRKRFSDRTSLAKVALLMIGLSWVSVLWAVNSQVAFQRNMAYTLLPLVFVFAVLNGTTKKEASFIQWAIVYGGALAAAFLYVSGPEHLREVDGRLSMGGDISDPNNTAAVLLLPLFVTVHNATQSRRTGARVALWALVGALLYAILLTGSRGTVVGLILAMSSYFVVSQRTSSRSQTLGVLAAGGVVAWFVGTRIPADVAERLWGTGAYFRDLEGAGTRSGIWRVLLRDVLPQLPPWGAGAGNAPGQLVSAFGYEKGVHNMYLSFLVEFGLFGLLVFGTFLFLLFRVAQRGNPLYFALLVSILTVSFFLDAYPKRFFWSTVTFVVLVAMVHSAPTEEPSEAKESVHLQPKRVHDGS